MQHLVQPLDATLERAYDPYGFIREAYSQRRLFQVYDGDVPEELLPKDEEEFEDYEDEPPAPDEEQEPDEPPSPEAGSAPGAQPG